MRAVTLPLPKLGFVIATRALLAAGLALMSEISKPKHFNERADI